MTRDISSTWTLDREERTSARSVLLHKASVSRSVEGECSGDLLASDGRTSLGRGGGRFRTISHLCFNTAPGPPPRTRSRATKLMLLISCAECCFCTRPCLRVHFLSLSLRHLNCSRMEKHESSKGPLRALTTLTGGLLVLKGADRVRMRVSNVKIRRGGGARVGVEGRSERKTYPVSRKGVKEKEEEENGEREGVSIKRKGKNLTNAARGLVCILAPLLSQRRLDQSTDDQIHRLLPLPASPALERRFSRSVFRREKAKVLPADSSSTDAFLQQNCDRHRSLLHLVQTPDQTPSSLKTREVKFAYLGRREKVRSVSV